MAGSHDISHCVGTNCPIKETCHRYIQHLEIESGIYKYPVAYFGVPFLTKEEQLLPENEQWVEEQIEWNRGKGRTIPPTILEKLIICHEYWKD